MSVSKIKNLILLILALAIIGLLPAVVPTQAARVGSEKKVHEKLEALYESYGLSLDASSLPASQTLYSIELENPDAKPAAQALLGGKAAKKRLRRGCWRSIQPAAARCSSAAPGSSKGASQTPRRRTI